MEKERARGTKLPISASFSIPTIHEDTAGWIYLGTRAQAFTMNPICQHLMLDFPVSMTVRNRLLLSINYQSKAFCDSSRNGLRHKIHFIFSVRLRPMVFSLK